MTDEATLLETQDRLFQRYNNGVIEAISSVLEENFLFVDGSVVGDGLLFEQRINRLYRYHAGKGMLPLMTVDPRTVHVVGDLGWIVCEVTAVPEGDSYGWLTQLFMRRSRQWNLVHHHFSVKIGLA